MTEAAAMEEEVFEGAGSIDPLEELHEYIEDGERVPVKAGDEITANGLEEWKDSPPMYHDLNFPSYVNFDVQEWTSRVKKYKYGVVSQAQRIQRLIPEVAALRKQLDTHSGDFESLDTAITETDDISDRLVTATAAEKKRRNELLTQINTLKTHCDNTKKSITFTKEEASSCLSRIGLLKEEVDGNRRRYESALGEKEKLNLERQWFFRERLLLEETTAYEDQDVAALLENVEKLRHSMHRAWKEAKEIDTLGHMRATKLTPADEDWYASRKRSLARARTSVPQYSMGSRSQTIEKRQ